MAWVMEYQRWLSESESLQNAQLVANHFSGTDWSVESIAALCGNMRHESSINPDMYEYGKTWEENRGYGLVQWTPRTKYWDWAVSQGLEPRNGDSQLSRIDYEIENNIQWIANGHQARYGAGDKYNISFAEFRANTENYSPNELTEAFMWNYEGPAYSAGSQSLVDRQAFTMKCINELDWTNIGTPQPTDPTNPTNPQSNNNKIYHLWLSGVMKW
jgi:hypothetical protein